MISVFKEAFIGYTSWLNNGIGISRNYSDLIQRIHSAPLSGPLQAQAAKGKPARLLVITHH